MASVLWSVVKAIKEKGLLNLVRELKNEGYTKCLLDGNLLQTKLYSIGAKVVGTNRFGNKYDECMENTQFGAQKISPSHVLDSHKEEMPDSSQKSRKEEIDNRSGGSGNMDAGSGEDQDDHSRNKRYHRHTAMQTGKMKAIFQKNQYPDEKERLKLSEEIGLEPCQVKFWFQNRRAQLKSQRDRVEDYQARKSKIEAIERDLDMAELRDVDYQALKSELEAIKRDYLVSPPRRQEWSEQGCPSIRTAIVAVARNPDS